MKTYETLKPMPIEGLLDELVSAVYNVAFDAAGGCQSSSGIRRSAERANLVIAVVNERFGTRVSRFNEWGTRG